MGSIAVVGFEDDNGAALITFVAIVAVLSVYYFLYAKQRQTLNAEEFKFNVLKYNMRARKLAKRRSSSSNEVSRILSSFVDTVSLVWSTSRTRPSQKRSRLQSKKARLQSKKIALQSKRALLPSKKVAPDPQGSSIGSGTGTGTGINDLEGDEDLDHLDDEDEENDDDDDDDDENSSEVHSDSDNMDAAAIQGVWESAPISNEKLSCEVVRAWLQSEKNDPNDEPITVENFKAIAMGVMMSRKTGPLSGKIGGISKKLFSQKKVGLNAQESPLPPAPKPYVPARGNAVKDAEQQLIVPESESLNEAGDPLFVTKKDSTIASSSNTRTLVKSDAGDFQLEDVYSSV